MYALRRPTVSFQSFVIFCAKILTLLLSPAPKLFWVSLSHSPIVSSSKPSHSPNRSYTHPLLQSLTQRPPPHPHADPLIQPPSDPRTHAVTPTYPFIHSPTHSCQYTHSLSFIYRLPDSLSPTQPSPSKRPLTDLPTRPPTHPFTDSLIHPQTHSVTHPHTLIQLTHSQSQPSTRSFRRYDLFISKILRLISRRQLCLLILHPYTPVRCIYRVIA
jgi:hypothetical protein